MKQQHKRKLALHKETLRKLDGMAMSRVVGGAHGVGEQSATSGQVCCSFLTDDCPTRSYACLSEALPSTCITMYGPSF